MVSGCGFAGDISPDGKYLLSPHLQSGIDAISVSDKKCIPIDSSMASFLFRFSSDGRFILYLSSARGQAAIYRLPWHDGKITGPPQPALKLPFALHQAYSGNAYDFSKDLSTVVYARPGGEADLYYLSQR